MTYGKASDKMAVVLQLRILVIIHPVFYLLKGFDNSIGFPFWLRISYLCNTMLALEQITMFAHLPLPHWHSDSHRPTIT